MNEDAAARIERMAKQNRQAVDLARLLSFAVLIEPALMRATRLELLPRVDVSAEADLWFGPLVQTRSRDGIVLLPGVAERLRAGLQDKLAERSWRITEHLHDYLPPAIQLEEKLNWLSINPAGNAQEIRELLQSALTALIGQKPRGDVANWAGRALPRLPRAVRETESAAMLAAASDLRLGRTSTLTEHLSGRQVPDWFADIVPKSLAKVALGIGVTSLGITLDPTPAPESQHIMVPATDPRVVQISARGESQIVFVDAKTSRSVPLSLDDGPIDLTTITGEAYTLERGRGESPDRAMACAVYADCNQALIVWQIATAIGRCLGFALERIDADGEPEFLKNALGFASTNRDTGPQPSTVWPIQRFIWIDRPPRRGAPYSYRVTPIIGVPGKVELARERAVRTNPVVVGVDRQRPLTAFFNREPSALRRQLSDASSVRAARDELGGEMRRELLSILLDAKSDGESTVYVALWRLDDPDLVEALSALGPRANIILSRDPVPDGESDRLSSSRRDLGDAQLYIRTNVQRFSHVDFMIVCSGRGEPKMVWTGSVVWTSGCLNGQDSNALLIEDAAIARRYFDQWQRLRNDPPMPTMMAANAASSAFSLADGSAATLWFAPVGNGEDLTDVRRCVAQARSAILFAIGPRPPKSVVDDILGFSSRLYVAGVARSVEAGNQVTVHQHGNAVAVTPERLPSDTFTAVDPRVSAVSPPIGSRLIVIDPFGNNPVVIAGSHGLSDGASRSNDEDLLIIRGNRRLAAQCAVHIMGLIDHYAFRARTLATSSSIPTSLRPDDGWQQPFLTGEREKEIRFWMGGQSELGSVPQESKISDVAPRQEPTREPPKPAKKTSAKISKKKKPAKKTIAKVTGKRKKK
jgi:hypothetical protein